LDFGLKRKKNPKEPQQAIMRVINSVFWLKVWHFQFYHFKVVGILYFAFYGEPNRPERRRRKGVTKIPKSGNNLHLAVSGKV
jgi:hypothetical protein